MAIDSKRTEALLTLLHQQYPDWQGFTHKKFVADEIHYKRAASEKARTLLARDRLKSLMDQSKYDDFIALVKDAAKGNNLLFTQRRNDGDTNILYDPELTPREFCLAFFDLLWGPGEAPERLGRYLEYVHQSGLPSKWPFPTYFLHLLQPDKELMIKPRATSWFCRFVGKQDTFSKEPSAVSYSEMRQLAFDLRASLEQYNPTDLIDIDSVIWVCYKISSASVLREEKREEFAELVNEFSSNYLHTDEAQNHLEHYGGSRRVAESNFAQIHIASSNHRDITDDVLLRLLPYTEGAHKQDNRAWVHIAPVFTADVRRKFEASGWVRPGEWANIAAAIFEFVRETVDQPGKIMSTCKQFSEQSYSKGFQTGTMSPILNALRPDEFLIVNNKSRAVINFLTGRNLRQQLTDYPKLNDLGRSLVSYLVPLIPEEVTSKYLASDVFDLFCHWLVSIKKYHFHDTNYWKISPGENACFWNEWLEGGYMAIGWDEIGDLSQATKADFDKRLDGVRRVHPDWKKSGMNQVWTFAKHIKEGDRIVANDGTKRVVGIGTVTGDYYFVPGVEYGHRIFVEWDDVTPKLVDKGGWRKTLIKLDYETFNAIKQQTALPPPPVAACPFDAETFDLLHGLQENPTKRYYDAHHAEFTEHLEEPFRNLLLRVGNSLPPPMQTVLETEKRIIARIPKNDYGRGGAHAYHWGAFFPKTSRRIADAQLFVWMNADSMEFGFYIGEYAVEQRERFLRNVKKHQSLLLEKVQPRLATYNLGYGPRQDFINEDGEDRQYSHMKPWLADLDSESIHVALKLSRTEVLSRTTDELEEQILGVFEGVFPLFQLAVLDDPENAIASFLGEAETHDASPEYPLAKCANDTGFDLDELKRWVRAIERKKQAIIYGPPGTGKTFIAEKLADHLIGGGDGFAEVVQFHSAYAYEDFVQGIRPRTTQDGLLEYPMRRGRFLEFCANARSCQDRCILIIDEINRANLSRVFGELMYLLEYRDKEVPLAGGGRFSIPSNVRIIGTMNTADRSIALVDYALRRRFAFLALYPNYDLLKGFHANGEFDSTGLIQVLKDLNTQIADRHYEVGITFFLRKDLAGSIEDVWRMEIEPYLEEYFFDQPDKVDRFRWNHVSERILNE